MTHDDGPPARQRPGAGPASRSRRSFAIALTAVAVGTLWSALTRLPGHASDSVSGSPASSTAASPRGHPAATPLAPANGAARVSIANFTFVPSRLIVAVGTEVTWQNHDDIPYTTTSVTKGAFASPILDTDDRFRFRFTSPGTFLYFCSIHPVMTGQVTVR